MTEEAPQQALPQDAQFAIQKVYVKDVSFETPNSPKIFQEDWQPIVDMHMTNEAHKVEDNIYDVVLSITVTVKLGEKTAYLAEINQAGVFLLKNLPTDLMDRILGTSCPNILFPFAREALSDLVMRGGFPQLLLSPVNFEALYEQQKQQQLEPEKPTTH